MLTLRTNEFVLQHLFSLTVPDLVHAILNSNIVLLLEKLHNFYWIVQILLHEFRII